MHPFNRYATPILATTFAFLIGCAETPTNEGTKAYLDDSVITTKVKSAILADSSLKSLEIGVETYKGKVQLSGFVSSDTEIHKAGAVARKVEGVRDVKNDLRLK